jgi:asparagine synthetase B (glutamine-hydrolysing)
MFDGIWSLPAGFKLLYNWKNGNLETTEYFNPSEYINVEKAKELERLKFSLLEKELKNTIDNSLRRIAQKKEAITVLLSGGTDSSGLAGLLSQHTDVHAVHIDVGGLGSDSELKYAQKVARHLNIELAVSNFGRNEFRESLCDAIYDLGMPIIIGNTVGLYHAATSGVVPSGQLMVDGEGADAHYYGSVPIFQFSLVTSVIAKAIGCSQERTRKILNKIRKVITKLGLSTTATIDSQGLNVILGARGLLPQNMLCKLMESFAHIDNIAEREIAALCLREFSDYLQPLVHRIDNMAAVAETNIVLPFVQQDIFEYSVNLPMKSKVTPAFNRKGYENKRIWKSLVSKIVPPEIVYRRKGGFSMQSGAWSVPIPNAWQKDSWVAEYFKLPNSALKQWRGQGAHGEDDLFVASMEIWGRLYEDGQSLETVRNEWLGS